MVLAESSAEGCCREVMRIMSADDLDTFASLDFVKYAE